MNCTTSIQSTVRRAAVAIIASSIILVACAPIRSLATLFRQTDHFVLFPDDNRIRIEPGAAHFAELISPHIAEAIKKVEAAHYAPFVSQPTIYVCATNEGYYRLTGQRAPATVTNKLYLSPELFQGQRPIDRYLAHELSHLHLVQRLGLFGCLRLPEWFKEGLAELASNGATGSSVVVCDALRAIHGGHTFIPDEGRNVVSAVLFPRYGSYWHLENRMFYRQSMLFVEFMRAQNEGAFQGFLVDLAGGTEFKKALQDAYHGDIPMLWGSFLKNPEQSSFINGLQADAEKAPRQ